MSRMGKACLVLAVLFLFATAIAFAVLNFFHPSLYVSAGLGFVFLIGAIAKDFRLYKEFFSMRTTKNGLAMGWLIVLGFVVFACVNYLAVRYNRSWDWSDENRNSLSEQSIKIAQNLKGEAKIIFLSRPGQDAESSTDEMKKNVRDLVELYQTRTQNLKLEVYNALTRPDLAQKYEFRFGPYGIFAEYNGKHLRIDGPTEEAITKALLKLSRDKKKVFYFLQGHKERPLFGEQPETISLFKQDLESTYEVKPLTLFESGNKVPDDAEVVAIVGPIQNILPPETQALKDYAARGGRFLIGADPGEKHNIAQIMKLFGIEFQNDFVLDLRAMVPGAGNVAALGSTYSKESEITKDLTGNPTLHIFASALKKAPDAPADWVFDHLVSTNDQSIATLELSEKPQISSRGPHVLAMSVMGKMPAASKEFAAVIVGDSDVFSNQIFYQYANRDFIMNASALLAKDEDIISIRPKIPQGTTITAAQMPAIRGLILALLILPLLMLTSGGVLWFRRRSA